jgi:23S rRNA (adenine2030-N6)-methyltransferase
MLSYQHAYHAGNRADIHKHNILARVLVDLCQDDAPIHYVETHAGRGLYNLESAPSYKTGEAAQGWLALAQDKQAIKKLSPAYVDAVRVLNDGKLIPRYPGSPKVAGHILSAQDKMYLMELHPAEHESLEKIFRKDTRTKIYKEDGLKKTSELVRGKILKGRGLVLIDPSYEVKSEYETIPQFAADLSRGWPEAGILVWAPMLPARRHEALITILKNKAPDLQISEVTWSRPEDGRGMYGSFVAAINISTKI